MLYGKTENVWYTSLLWKILLSLILLRSNLLLSVVTHAYKLRNLEVDAGGSRLQDEPWLQISSRWCGVCEILPPPKKIKTKQKMKIKIKQLKPLLLKVSNISKIIRLKHYLNPVVLCTCIHIFSMLIYIYCIVLETDTSVLQLNGVCFNYVHFVNWLIHFSYIYISLFY